MQELYIGLMSGTSLDGIDAVIVDLSKKNPQLIASAFLELPHEVKQLATQVSQLQKDDIASLYQLDYQFGHLFADAALAILDKAKIPAEKIKAIGSHGQTLRHQPNAPQPYTIQVGDPNIIATRTRITTVADFRRKDLANGGQGAPFAPLFHAQVLSDEQENRVIVNVGGIANITLLPKGVHKALLGFDTGPGNGLMDAWTQLHLSKAYDTNGNWAAQGKVDQKLLTELLQDPFFRLPPPKSTGLDYFNLTWLKKYMHKNSLPEDVQATLAELTAMTMTDAIKQLSFPCDRMIICGGGAHNLYLIQRLQALNPIPVNISDNFSIPVDYVEAMLFAWLAQQTLLGKTLDLTPITGSLNPVILGGIYTSHT